MKKMLAFMLAAAMVLTIATNVFAVTTIVPNAISVPAWTNNSHGLSATVDSYAFTATTNGTVYHYQLIDEETVNGKKNYYIFANDLYQKLSKFPFSSAAFDPELAGNIAYWLNNDFYNGTATTTLSLDLAIKPYIQNHTYMVEGHKGFGETSSYYYDYNIETKIALLSLTELNTYKDKIGYQAYWNNSTNLTGTSYCAYLRTPEITDKYQAIKYMNPANGNVAQASNMATNGYIHYIRPTFWVSEDYFKEIELTSCGTEVQKIVDSFDTGVTVLTEDAQDISELSVDEWYFSGTNAVASDVSTVSDGVIAITEGKWIGRKLPSSINSGIICVETDVNYTQANGYLDLCIGFTFENSATSPSYKYPLYFTKGSTLAKYRFKASASSSSASYKQFENIYYDIGFDGATTAHLKFVVDLDTGYHYISIDGKNSGILKDLSYITDNVINGTDAIDKIVFYNPNGNATGYTLDNIKITHDENGSVIDTIEVTGEKEITITSKDYASFASVSASDISITDCSVANIAANNNVLTVTTEEKLSEDKTYYAIVDGITRSDIPDYNIIGNFDSFEVNKFTFTNPVIDAKFASGEVVKATMTVTKGDVDSKDVTLVIAAYNGDRLIGMNSDTFNSDTDTQKNLEASFTLKESATELRAFVWDENRFPLCAFVPALNN